MMAGQFAKSLLYQGEEVVIFATDLGDYSSWVDSNRGSKRAVQHCGVDTPGAGRSSTDRCNSWGEAAC